MSKPQEFLDEESLWFGDSRTPFLAGLAVGAILGLIGAFATFAFGKDLAKSLLQFGLLATLMVFGVFWFTINQEILDRSGAARQALKSALGWIVGFYSPLIFAWVFVGVGMLDALTILAITVGLLAAIFSGFHRPKRHPSTKIR